MLVSINKAAKMLRINQRTLKAMIDEGLLKAIKTANLKHPKLSTAELDRLTGTIQTKKRFDLKPIKEEAEYDPFTNKKAVPLRHRTA